ncbi:amidase [Barrientosiimonas marina]|uniref:Amidase n=1 Tax=Lentibacillus kimchii TaxID=1542911 RepID=A0ABW2URN5_9BACI
MDVKTYTTLDATAIAELIQRHEMQPSEFLQLAFRRLEAVNPSLNAVVQQRKDRVMAEADTVAMDRLFSGVPLLLKNLTQSIAGEELNASSRLMQATISQQDATIVSTFREAGFLLMGHSNAPEFGLKNITEPALYGPARNPWNTNHSPGGSSGGSAAAIASGVVPAAGASDGGGSIRIPASFTGLFGLKPTRGRTPVGPGAGRQWQGAAIDFALSKSVRDSAAILDNLQVVQPEAAFQTPLFAGNYLKKVTEPFTKPLRIAFTTESPVGTPVSGEAREAVRKTVKWLAEQGHHVEEQAPDIDGVDLMRHYYMMNSGEIAALGENLAKTIGRPLTENDLELETWLLNTAGQSVSAADYSISLGAWDQAAARMAAFHETYDLYLTPASAFPAPEVGELTYSQERQAVLREQMHQLDKHEQQDLIYDVFLPSLTYTPFSQLANLTGQPAMSVPVHTTASGLPLGVQFMTGKGQEDLLLKLAGDMEKTDVWAGMRGNPYMTQAD